MNTPSEPDFLYAEHRERQVERGERPNPAQASPVRLTPDQRPDRERRDLRQVEHSANIAIDPAVFAAAIPSYRYGGAEPFVPRNIWPRPNDTFVIQHRRCRPAAEFEDPTIPNAEAEEWVMHMRETNPEYQEWASRYLGRPEGWVCDLPIWRVKPSRSERYVACANFDEAKRYWTGYSNAGVSTYRGDFRWLNPDRIVLEDGVAAADAEAQAFRAARPDAGTRTYRVDSRWETIPEAAHHNWRGGDETRWPWSRPGTIGELPVVDGLRRSCSIPMDFQRFYSDPVYPIQHTGHALLCHLIDGTSLVRETDAPPHSTEGLRERWAFADELDEHNRHLLSRMVTDSVAGFPSPSAEPWGVVQEWPGVIGTPEPGFPAQVATATTGTGPVWDAVMRGYEQRISERLGGTTDAAGAAAAMPQAGGAIISR